MRAPSAANPPAFSTITVLRERSRLRKQPWGSRSIKWGTAPVPLGLVTRFGWPTAFIKDRLAPPCTPGKTERPYLKICLPACNARSGFHLDSTPYKILSVAASMAKVLQLFVLPVSALDCWIIKAC